MKVKAKYKVYQNGINAILEVSRGEKKSVYFIEDLTGHAELLQETAYIPKEGEREEEYFVDRLSGPALNTIDVLTTDFNYDLLISQFKQLKEMIQPDRYQISYFSMEMSYIFLDLEDVMKQLYYLTEEAQYKTEQEKANEFFNIYFYQRETPLMPEDFETISEFFDKQISFLESLKSN